MSRLGFRDRVTKSATSIFKHAGYPLQNTLEHRGDPGLCGPDSVSWRVIGDPAAFAGGIRALLVQAAHPEVAAGVDDHSRYRQDPLGRLSRTSNYVTATTYGAMEEVEHAVALVRRMHHRVEGESHRGTAYSADMPQLAAWVHNALTDSFLVAHQAFGPRSLDEREADRFVEEQVAVGRMLGAATVPATAEGLSRWIVENAEVDGSPGSARAVRFLHHPPLRGGVRLGHRVLYQGAVATLPGRIRRALGVRRIPGARMAARLLVGFLRWALGSSPSWKLALTRVGKPIPDGLFRQPLPTETLEDWERGGSPA